MTIFSIFITLICLSIIGIVITCNTTGTSACLTASIAYDMSPQAEANQVNVLPVSTSGVNEPDEEFAKELAHARDAVWSGNVVWVSESAPVYNNYINILDSKEGRRDEGVYFGVSITVPSVNNDFKGMTAVVVGVPDWVSVAVDDNLWIIGVISEK